MQVIRSLNTGPDLGHWDMVSRTSAWFNSEKQSFRFRLLCFAFSPKRAVVSKFKKFTNWKHTDLIQGLLSSLLSIHGQTSPGHCRILVSSAANMLIFSRCCPLLLAWFFNFPSWILCSCDIFSLLGNFHHFILLFISTCRKHLHAFLHTLLGSQYSPEDCFYPQSIC